MSIQSLETWEEGHTESLVCVRQLSVCEPGCILPHAALDAVQEALTAFMEDIISHMAGYVPLKAIAERILASYASDPFGDFKVWLGGTCIDCKLYSTQLGLINAMPEMISWEQLLLRLSATAQRSVTISPAGNLGGAQLVDIRT
jgi:hypothetical protein